MCHNLATSKYQTGKTITTEIQEKNTYLLFKRSKELISAQYKCNLKQLSSKANKKFTRLN